MTCISAGIEFHVLRPNWTGAQLDRSAKVTCAKRLFSHRVFVSRLVVSSMFVISMFPALTFVRVVNFHKCNDMFVFYVVGVAAYVQYNGT